MNKEIILFNFTNIYKEENFYLANKYKMIDLSNLSSTQYICSKENIDILSNICKDINLNTIHFIDELEPHTRLYIFE